MRIEEGGWARQTTKRELPTSTQLAGVNMRLDEGGSLDFTPTSIGFNTFPTTDSNS